MKRLLLVALAITGILAAGCIVRFGSLYTQDDTSHFVGLASNLSKVDVIAASVKVDFYDSGNHLLDSKLVSPCTRTLQIGMDSPFEAVPNDGVVANHVQTTVQWLTLGHKTVADLDTDNIAVSTDSGETHITGTIDANEDLRSVNVCAALLNSSGAVVKVGNDSAGNIDDGDSADFDVSMTSDDTATQFDSGLMVSGEVTRPRPSSSGPRPCPSSRRIPAPSARTTTRRLPKPPALSVTPTTPSPTTGSLPLSPQRTLRKSMRNTVLRPRCPAAPRLPASLFQWT